MWARVGFCGCRALEEDVVGRILVLSFLLRNQFVLFDKFEVCSGLCLELRERMNQDSSFYLVV